MVKGQAIIVITGSITGVTTNSSRPCLFSTVRYYQLLSYYFLCPPRSIHFNFNMFSVANKPPFV